MKVKLPHAAVAALLSRCQCKEGGGGSKGRVQWDPARDLMTSENRGSAPRKMLRARAIQIGLSRDLSEMYVRSVVSIEEVTGLAHQVLEAHQHRHEADVKAAMVALLPLLPQERPYLPRCPDEELQRLQMRWEGHSARLGGVRGTRGHGSGWDCLEFLPL